LHGAQKANLIGVIVVLGHVGFKLPRHQILVIGQVLHVQYLSHQAEETIGCMGENLLQVFGRHFQVTFAEFSGQRALQFEQLPVVNVSKLPKSAVLWRFGSFC
jgi:hypothetical protein